MYTGTTNICKRINIAAILQPIQAGSKYFCIFYCWIDKKILSRKKKKNRSVAILEQKKRFSKFHDSYDLLDVVSHIPNASDFSPETYSFVALYINLKTPCFLFPLLLPHPFTSPCSLCKQISPLLTAVLVFFETKLWFIYKGDLLQQIISQSIAFGWEPQLDKQREGAITCKMEGSLNKEVAHLENVPLFPAE